MYDITTSEIHCDMPSYSLGLGVINTVQFLYAEPDIILVHGHRSRNSSVPSRGKRPGMLPIVVVSAAAATSEPSLVCALCVMFFWSNTADAPRSKTATSLRYVDNANARTARRAVLAHRVHRRAGPAVAFGIGPCVGFWEMLPLLLLTVPVNDGMISPSLCYLLIALILAATALA
eukprot:CAMPEP_0178583578 /NCGR_PEP_ID=MMETSP0697-20121206/24333_1 /TAXON_ID=265572 /ORGANISM="Extubocellulus spinifer, Strain CCMP396" /LENGTH=174 /DNA_ID=CAMNT_0020219387 /DNA_START=187 /DNA_END=711 /DNA_ORIENTATION=+